MDFSDPFIGHQKSPKRAKILTTSVTRQNTLFNETNGFAQIGMTISFTMLGGFFFNSRRPKSPIVLG